MNDVERARFDQQYAKHVNALKLQGVARDFGFLHRNATCLLILLQWVLKLVTGQDSKINLRAGVSAASISYTRHVARVRQ